MRLARRIEVFTGTERRRRWDAETMAKIVGESYASAVGDASDRHGVRKTQLFTWRRDARRAETLPIDQLELALEDVEQVQAEADAPVAAISGPAGPARAWTPH